MLSFCSVMHERRTTKSGKTECFHSTLGSRTQLTFSRPNGRSACGIVVGPESGLDGLTLGVEDGGGRHGVDGGIGAGPETEKLPGGLVPHWEWTCQYSWVE